MIQGGSARSRKSTNSRSVPDKDGKFELYIFKNDLTEDFKNDPKLCMWRRDGSSLLQKYIREKDEDGKTDELIFNGSSVVSYNFPYTFKNLLLFVYLLLLE